MKPRIRKNLKVIFLVLVVFSIYLPLAIFYNGLLTDDGATYLLDGETLVSGELPESRIQRILHQLTFALLELIFGYNVPILRMYVLLASAGSSLVMFLILRKKFNDENALYGALLFSSAPALVYISPTMITGPVGLFYTMLGLYLFTNYLDGQKRYIFYSSIVVSIGFLIRETVFAVFLSIFLFLLMKRKVRVAVGYSLVFFILPGIYSLLLFSINVGNPWLEFFSFNVEKYGSEYTNVSFFVKHYLLSLGLLGVMGPIALIKGMKMKDEYGTLLLIYLTISFLLLLIWPISSIRFFITLLPAMCYFFARLLTNRFIKFASVLTIISGIIIGVTIGYFFITLQKPTGDAIEWVNENLPLGSKIYVNTAPLEYHLKNRGYRVVDNNEEYAILSMTNWKIDDVSENTLRGDLTLLKEFSYERPSFVKRFAYGEGQTTGIYRISS